MSDTEAENSRLDGEIAASVKSLGDTIDTLFAQNMAMKDALTDCQGILALLADRKANLSVSGPGIVSAYALCVAAEAKARAVLKSLKD